MLDVGNPAVLIPAFSVRESTRVVAAGATQLLIPDPYRIGVSFTDTGAGTNFIHTKRATAAQLGFRISPTQGLYLSFSIHGVITQGEIWVFSGGGGTIGIIELMYDPGKLRGNNVP